MNHTDFTYDFNVEELYSYLNELFGSRIVILDGGIGTSLQKLSLVEEQFRGEKFKEHEIDLNKNFDILNLTQPEIIKEVYEGFLKAGSDIISTNTFNSNKISQEKFGTSKFVKEINQESAKLAREAADLSSKEGDWKLVAGSLGPTTVNLSLSSEYTSEDIKKAYKEQLEGLVLGGCHIILFETIVDLKTAKAGLEAYSEFFEEKDLAKLPLFISGCPINEKGENLSGHSVQDFYEDIKVAKPFCVGLNCCFGAKQMLPFIQALAETSEFYLLAYPNAGFPDKDLKYHQSIDSFIEETEEFFKSGINAIGGCCGTDHTFIKAVKESAQAFKPRKL